MASFTEGHTTNVGATYQAAKVKRIMKRRSREADEKMLAALMPEDLLPTPTPPRKKYKIHPNTLANLNQGEKGYLKYAKGGKKKRTGSIKEKLISELTRRNQADGLFIARRLISMAKAGDLRAIEILMERMDGKVPTTIGGDKENPLVIQVEPILAAKYSKRELPSPEKTT